MSGPAKASDIAKAYGVDSALAQSIVSVAGRVGIPDPAWLANLIHHESRFNPQAVNPSTNATGLIQFIPSTARSLGTTTDALRGMTGVQQMAYVEKYLSKFKGKFNSPADTYMAVFYPAAIGKPADWSFPSEVSRYNPGITKPADYAAKLEKYAKLPTMSGAAVSKYASNVSWAIALFSLGGALVLWLRTRR